MDCVPIAIQNLLREEFNINYDCYIDLIEYTKCFENDGTDFLIVPDILQKFNITNYWFIYEKNYKKLKLPFITSVRLEENGKQEFHAILITNIKDEIVSYIDRDYKYYEMNINKFCDICIWFHIAKSEKR